MSPGQVMEKEGPQPAESEESSIYSPAFPREKWQRKRTQVKIRVWVTLGLHGARAVPRRCGVMQPGGFAPILVDSHVLLLGAVLVAVCC